MSENEVEHDSEAISSTLRDARLIYGAALVGEELTMIECVDEQAFEDGPDRSMLTALTSVGADLVPFVDEHEFDGKLPVPAMPYGSDDVALSRVTAFEEAVSVLTRSRACYVLVDHGDDDWSRIRNVDPDAFDDGPIDAPADGRYAVARALVAESTDQTAEFDTEVDPDDPIRPIVWTD